MGILVTLFVIILVIVLASIKQIDEYQRGV